MVKRLILSLSFWSFLYTAYSQISAVEISKCLAKHQPDNVGSMKKLKFSQVRQKLLSKYPNIISQPINTLCFLERYDIESATYFGCIWNNKDTVNYLFHLNTISLSDDNNFGPKTMNYVSNWDTVSIKNEEKLYENSPKKIFAAKCVVQDNSVLVSVLTITEFVFDRFSRL